MKKSMRMLVLVLVLCLGMTAAAENTEQENARATITDIFTGATVKFSSLEDGEGKISVTYTNADAVKEGQFYLVMVVAGDTANGYTPTKDSILYIDQTTGDANGSISFEVYPSSIQDSAILIYGTDINGEADSLIAAIINGKFILGDVNCDKTINNKDIVLFSQYLASVVEELSAQGMSAADINKDKVVNNKDIVILSQFLANVIETLG